MKWSHSKEYVKARDNKTNKQHKINSRKGAFIKKEELSVDDLFKLAIPKELKVLDKYLCRILPPALVRRFEIIDLPLYTRKLIDEALIPTELGIIQSSLSKKRD